MISILPQDVLIHCPRLDVLVLLLEVLRQMHQVGLQFRTRRHTPQALERHIKLPLALKGQAHHAIGLLGILVCLPRGNRALQQQACHVGRQPRQQHQNRKHKMQPLAPLLEPHPFQSQQSNRQGQ